MSPAVIAAAAQPDSGQIRRTVGKFRRGSGRRRGLFLIQPYTACFTATLRAAFALGGRGTLRLRHEGDSRHQRHAWDETEQKMSHVVLLFVRGQEVQLATVRKHDGLSDAEIRIVAGRRAGDA